MRHSLRAAQSNLYEEVSSCTDGSFDDSKSADVRGVTLDGGVLHCTSEVKRLQVN